MSPTALTIEPRARTGRIAIVLGVLHFVMGCAHFTPPTASNEPNDGSPVMNAPLGSSSDSAIDELCVGAAHSCALGHDGRVACWGNNGQYQASSAEVGQLDTPRWVSDFPKARRLRCGSYSTCIQTPEGALQCLGFQYHDEARCLRCTPPVAGPARGPLEIPLPQPALDFILNSAGGCAILDDHSVTCWSDEDPLEPFPITGVNDAEAFAPGGLDASSVSITRTHAAPTRIHFAGRDPDQASEGFPFHVTVLPALAGATRLLFTRDGQLCANRAGAITCATEGNAPSPARLEGVVPTELLATSWFLSCFRGGSAVRCIEPNGPSPLASGVPGALTALAVSDHHACALVQGRALCWGEAGDGQLGVGARYLHGPEPVPGITDATSVSTAHGLVCATRKSDKLSCWGSSKNWGALATSIVTEIATPGPIADLFIGTAEMPCGRFGKAQLCWDGRSWVPRVSVEGPAPPLAAFEHSSVISLSTDEACAIDREGRVGCLKELGYPAKPGNVVWINGAFVEVASFGEVFDRRLVCARKRDGHLACFHCDADRQWGAMSWPALETLADVTKLRASSFTPLGTSFAKPPTLGCALTHSGEVTCVGDPWLVGLGSSTPSTVAPVAADGPFPVAKVEALPAATDIAVSGSFACATTRAGQVDCWGSNRRGGAPNGAPSRQVNPVPVRWPPP